MENSHEIREFVWLYDRIDIMESWTEELENKLIELQQQNECLYDIRWKAYSDRSRMSVINNELTCLALTGCVPLNARRRSASFFVDGVQSDATQLISTQLDVVEVSKATQLTIQLNLTSSWVKLSCVAINGAYHFGIYDFGTWPLARFYRRLKKAIIVIFVLSVSTLLLFVFKLQTFMQ